MEALSLQKISGINYDALAAASPYLAESLLSNPEQYSKAMEASFRFVKYLKARKQSRLLKILAEHEKGFGETGLLMLSECILIILNDILKARLSSSREILNRRKMDQIQEWSEVFDDKSILAIENLIKKSITEHREGFAAPLKYRLIHATAVACHVLQACEASK